MSPPLLILRICTVSAYERPFNLRIPFRFGDVVVDQSAEAYVVVTIEINGKCHTGYGAQAMMPRWFDKRTTLNSEQTVEELRDTVRFAALLAIGMQGSVAALSYQIRQAVRQAMPTGTPTLAVGFGAALLEMALIDAVCRAKHMNFFAAAQNDIFGLVAQCPVDISRYALHDHLKSIRPQWQIGLRHTVSYDAPLTVDAVINQPGDGLPVALNDVIQKTSIQAFKIKLKGDVDADIQWLCDVATVLDSLECFSTTLDANEQYGDDDFSLFLVRLAEQPSLARFKASILFIEQPFAREVALADDGPIPPKDMPIVIDESDDDDSVFPASRARGWAGISVKSCKGVLRALLNFARVQQIRVDGGQAILTGEDLTCQPGLCWQQDTLMAAAVGITHVERNGHHFAGGMQGAPKTEILASMAAHPDIYKMQNACPTLNIRDGQVGFASLDMTGFGSSPIPDFTQNTELTKE